MKLQTLILAFVLVTLAMAGDEKQLPPYVEVSEMKS